MGVRGTAKLDESAANAPAVDGSNALRILAFLIVIVIVSLPSLFAGLPGLAPDWFDRRWQGVPLSVVAMSGLMLVFVLLAGVCSAAAKDKRLPGAN